MLAVSIAYSPSKLSLAPSTAPPASSTESPTSEPSSEPPDSPPGSGSVGSGGVVTGGIVLGSAILGCIYPEKLQIFGVVGMIFSILSLIGAFGGLIIGMLLGIVGGALCAAWGPDKGEKFSLLGAVASVPGKLISLFRRRKR